MNDARPPSGPKSAYRSPVYADNMTETGMLTKKVEQVMRVSNGHYNRLPTDIKSLVNMYIEWQRVTPQTYFYGKWNTYVANMKAKYESNSHDYRAFFDGLSTYDKQTLLQMALSSGHPPGAESMPQANPFMITAVGRLHNSAGIGFS